MEEIAAAPNDPKLIQPEKPSRGRFIKGLWRFLKWSFIVVLVLIVALVSVVFIYEKEAKDMAIRELSKRLAVEVKVDANDIDLTVLRTFPYAAIEFRNVIVFESLKKKDRDTIIEAGRFSMQFNVMDLWNGKYDIHRIVLADTKIDFLTDKEGRNNFEFLKKSADTSSSGVSDLKFKLEEIVFENIRYRYRNKKEHIKVKGNTEKLKLNGAFSSAEYILNAEGKLFFDDLVLFDRSLFSGKNVNLTAQANVNGGDWSITNTAVSVNQLNLSAKGTVEKKDSLLLCDLELSGNRVDVKSALSLLPAAHSEKIKDYDSEGSFYFKSILKGQLNNFDKLSVETTFGVTNATVRYIPADSKLNNLNLEGRYYKPIDGKDKLELKNVSANLGSNFIKGNCTFLDMSDPNMELDAEINAELSELIKFYPIDTIAHLSGRVNANAKISGRMMDLKDNYAEQKVSTSGSATVDNLCLLFKNSNDSLKIKSGSLEINRNDLKLKEIRVVPKDNEIVLNGELSNFFAWLLKENETLTIKGNAFGQKIKIDQFLTMFGGTASENNTLAPIGNNPKQTNDRIVISDKFNLDFDIKVGQAEWEKFTAENVSGKLRVKDGKIFADDLNFRAFDGDVTFTGIAEALPEKIIFKGSSELVGVNINKLFYQFNNFHQDVIQDKHIKGVATVSLAFNTAWSHQLICDMGSINVSSDILIERGELNDYQPLDALAKYVELSELKKIKFSTLTSHVDIKDKTVTIAKTDVKSTAMNLAISGTHTFNNDIEYRIAILMSELMAKRPGKNKQLDDELKFVENDPENKRTVFIRMYGNMDDIKFAYDRKSAKEKLKQDIKNEKQNLKQILKEEFGIFKKDTTLNNAGNTNKKSDQVFKVDFGENNKQGTQTNKTGNTNSNTNNTNTNQQKKKKEKEEEDDDDF